MLIARIKLRDQYTRRSRCGSCSQHMRCSRWFAVQLSTLRQRVSTLNEKSPGIYASICSSFADPAGATALQVTGLGRQHMVSMHCLTNPQARGCTNNCEA